MLLSESFLREHARTEMKKAFCESMNSMKHFAEEQEYDIFISHSSLDEELTCSLYCLFKENGFSVYLDYEDNQLNPQIVTDETGKRIRNRLNNSKCLAYVATSNISSSRWCPWELGFFDGISNGKCCVLPILRESKETFNGQEYLGLYPYLTYEQAENSDKWYFWINDPKNSRKYTRLKSWIEGKEMTEHE